MKRYSEREINVGRITGLSSYELAVKHGYQGTEEEYVNKENAVYNNVVNYYNKIKEEFDKYPNLTDLITSRMNDLGKVSNINNIYEYYTTNANYHIPEDDNFSYTCSESTSMIIGMEQQSNGVQLRLSWIFGLQIRIKTNGVWSDWKSIVTVSPTEGV